MAKQMALAGVKVIEMAGLAPAPFCGMILSDFGAKVIRIDRTGTGITDTLSRGKKSIAVDLKAPEGVSLVRRLCLSADVLIEPFRPGVMEKLGLGPDVLMKENPRLVYARLTGFGQTGYYSQRAGHDINYLAISGVLSRLGRQHEKPYAPINLLADFAGGGLTCAFGVMLALYERIASGQGQVIDSNMVEGAAYISSFLWKMAHSPIWGEKRGTGFLDGGAHFYNTYETSDGKYMAVGALEPKFYAALLKGLGLNEDDVPQVGDAKQLETFTRVFASKTQEEWCKVFDSVDACVTPVLERTEAAEHPHNKQRSAHFMSSQSDTMEPRPAPHLSRSPGRQECAPHPLTLGADTTEILAEAGFTTGEIKKLFDNNIVEQATEESKL